METKGIAGEGGLPAGEPEVTEAIVIVRHRLWGRMAGPVPRRFEDI